MSLFNIKGSLNAVTELVAKGFLYIPYIWVCKASKFLLTLYIYLVYGFYLSGGNSGFLEIGRLKPVLSVLKGDQILLSPVLIVLFFFKKHYWSIVDLQCGVQALNKEEYLAQLGLWVQPLPESGAGGGGLIDSPCKTVCTGERRALRA